MASLANQGGPASAGPPCVPGLLFWSAPFQCSASSRPVPLSLAASLFGQGASPQVPGVSGRPGHGTLVGGAAPGGDDALGVLGGDALAGEEAVDGIVADAEGFLVAQLRAQ